MWVSLCYTFKKLTNYFPQCLYHFAFHHNAEGTISVWPHQHLVLYIFFAYCPSISISLAAHCILIYIPLTNDTKHLFMCSSAICLSSLVKCLKISANFKTVQFFFYYCKSYLYIFRYRLFIRCIICNVLSPTYGYLFHFLNGGLRHERFFYFDEVKLINFSFRVQDFTKPCLKKLYLIQGYEDFLFTFALEVFFNVSFYIQVYDPFELILYTVR